MGGIDETFKALDRLFEAVEEEIGPAMPERLNEAMIEAKGALDAERLPNRQSEGTVAADGE